MVVRVRHYRPSGAVVIALVALFFSVGGVGYAKQVVALVNGHRIKKGSIELNRLSKTAQGALKGQTGPRGIEGQTGPRGIDGPPGPSTGPAGGDLSGSYPNPAIAAGAVTDANVSTANKDGAAGKPSLRTLGTGALQAMPGNALPGGPPTGPANGGLSGSYPSPTIAAGAVDTPNFATGAIAPNASKLGGVAASGFWQLAGNAGTNPASDFLGTTDSQPLTFKVNGQRALQLEPAFLSPNVIGGHLLNSAAGRHGATIAGGGMNCPCGPSQGHNTVTNDFGAIGGGFNNTVGGLAATVGGGHDNTASGLTATVGGGRNNTASGSDATASGHANTASGQHASALGDSNTASGDNSLAFGFGNTAGGNSSTALGHNITASGQHASALGDSNTASGDNSLASGFSSTASANGSSALGAGNSAGGANSFAGGNTATVRSAGTGAPDDNSFVWSDGSGGISSSGANQFDVRAAGGVTFQTNASGVATGVQLASGGGSWSSLSDVHSKTAIRPVSVQALLARLARVPISEWSYKAQGARIRHIGPMAQDLYAAFGLGEDPRHIDTIDSEGLALAAIQGLDRQLHAQQVQIADLKAQNLQLKHQQAQIHWLMRHAKVH